MAILTCVATVGSPPDEQRVLACVAFDNKLSPYNEGETINQTIQIDPLRALSDVYNMYINHMGSSTHIIYKPSGTQ